MQMLTKLMSFYFRRFTMAESREVAHEEDFSESGLMNNDFRTDHEEFAGPPEPQWKPSASVLENTKKLTKFYIDQNKKQ